MKISKLLIGLFAGAISLAAYAQQPIVIKFSHVVAKWVKALDTKRLDAVLNDETQDEADFPELVLDDAPDIEIPHSPRPIVEHH